MDDYWYNEDKGWWYGEFEMAYECIDKCEYEWNGNQFINKWKEWFYELMNIVFKWCDLKHNRLIVVIYCYLLLIDMFNEWIMTFIFEYVNLLSEKHDQSMTIM